MVLGVTAWVERGRQEFGRAGKGGGGGVLIFAQYLDLERGGTHLLLAVAI